MVLRNNGLNWVEVTAATYTAKMQLHAATTIEEIKAVQYN